MGKKGVCFWFAVGVWVRTTSETKGMHVSSESMPGHLSCEN